MRQRKDNLISAAPPNQNLRRWAKAGYTEILHNLYVQGSTNHNVGNINLYAHKSAQCLPAWHVILFYGTHTVKIENTALVKHSWWHGYDLVLWAKQLHIYDVEVKRLYTAMHAIDTINTLLHELKINLSILPTTVLCYFMSSNGIADSNISSSTNFLSHYHSKPFSSKLTLFSNVDIPNFSTMIGCLDGYRLLEHIGLHRYFLWKPIINA